MDDANDWRKSLRAGDVVAVMMDDKSVVTRAVRAEPWELYGHSWILGLVGIAGGYSLDRVVSLVRKNVVHKDTAVPVCPKCGVNLPVVSYSSDNIDCENECACGCRYRETRIVTVAYTTEAIEGY